MAESRRALAVARVEDRAMIALYHITQLAVIFFSLSLTAWLWLFYRAVTIYGYGWTKARLRARRAFWCMMVSAPIAACFVVISIVATELLR